MLSDDPPPLGEVRCLYGGVQTENYHRGLACLLRVGMKTKGWLGDRGRGLACLLRVGMKTKGWLGDRGSSRIVLDRGKEGLT
jgi:hypothetical protein